MSIIKGSTPQELEVSSRNWLTLRTDWVRIAPLSGNESWKQKAGALHASRRTRVTSRQRQADRLLHLSAAVGCS